ncbi:MAG: hypothetical protein ABJL99_00010 [Aliishimia sp.]
MTAPSANCEFAHQQILQLRRMSGLTGCTAACDVVVGCPLWAVSVPATALIERMLRCIRWRLGAHFAGCCIVYEWRLFPYSAEKFLNWGRIERMSDKPPDQQDPLAMLAVHEAETDKLFTEASF